MMVMKVLCFVDVTKRYCVNSELQHCCLIHTFNLGKFSEELQKFQYWPTELDYEARIWIHL